MNTTQAYARSTDPETSHEAAGSISAEHLRQSQWAVLHLFQYYGPMTHDETISNYNLNKYEQCRDWPKQSPSGIRTRCRELVRMGRIRDSGQRQVLATGRKAIVWEVVV